MKKYRVVQDCVGHPFNKRYFTKGEIIEVADGVNPSSDCFELVTDSSVKPTETAKPPEGISLKELGDVQTGLANQKAGMAANLEEVDPLLKTPQSGKTKGKKTAG